MHNWMPFLYVVYWFGLNCLWWKWQSKRLFHEINGLLANLKDTVDLGLRNGQGWFAIFLKKLLELVAKGPKDLNMFWHFTSEVALDSDSDQSCTVSYTSRLFTKINRQTDRQTGKQTEKPFKQLKKLDIQTNPLSSWTKYCNKCGLLSHWVRWMELWISWVNFKWLPPFLLYSWRSRRARDSSPACSQPW